MKSKQSRLSVEHIIPYLPYAINFSDGDFEHEFVGIEFCRVAVVSPFNDFGHFALTDNHGMKPILRPLSDITKEILHEGKRFVPMERLRELRHRDDDFRFIGRLGSLMLKRLKGDLEREMQHAPYKFTNALFSWHFDVFGLIDQGLAVEKSETLNLIEG